eukprot:jgi/Chlat1/591/Chrsp103S00954
MSPSISPLTLFLLVLAFATKTLANAQVPPPPPDDCATITGRDYPRSNAQVSLTCTGTDGHQWPPQTVTLTDVTTLTNANDMFNFTRLAETRESAYRQVLLGSATCNNPINFNAYDLHAGLVYNGDVCFTEVPTTKNCITTTATECARSLVSSIQSRKDARTGRNNYTIKSVSLSNMPTKVLYTHLTKAMPAYNYITSEVQVTGTG